MRSIKFYFIALISTCYFLAETSCNNLNQLDPRAKLVIKSTDKMLRGVQFDESLKAVKNYEDGELIKEFEDYLSFKINLDTIYPGEQIDAEYFFNNRDQLDLIIVFYSLQNKNEIEPLVTDLKQYFERKYGIANEDEIGWYNWEFESKTGLPGSIEINLVSETEEGYMGVEVEMLKYYEFEKNS